MSFRGRLFIFFTIIVIVPMAAVAVVLFRVTADSETGKSDARIAQGLTTALAIYQADVDRAHASLRDVAAEPHMSRALARGKKRPIRLLARKILNIHPELVAINYYDAKGNRVSYTKRERAVAYATAAPTTASGRQLGTLAVSRTSARDYVRSVKRLTGLEAQAVAGGQSLAGTLGGAASGRP